MENYFDGSIGREYFAGKTRTGLPRWAYTSAKFFDYEFSKVFLTHWQMVGHIAEIPKVGDYLTYNLVNERAFVIRDEKGQLRAFHNICRHRSSKLVSGFNGNCGHFIQCPFHGWIYNLDGSLRGVEFPKMAFDSLDKSQLGLKPIELDIWRGFIFIRFIPSVQPSMAEIMAPFEHEFDEYPMDKLTPVAESVFTQEANSQEMVFPSNWKSAVDVDNEGYHVHRLHTYLEDLYGGQYYDMPYTKGGHVMLSRGIFNDKPKKYWTTRLYKELTAKHCLNVSPKARNQALYVAIFPTNVIQLYPESLNFYQYQPHSPNTMTQRFTNYTFGNETRELKLINKLNLRIDRVSVEEDTDATEWCFDATKSSGYQGVYLTNLEPGVHSFHEKLRELIPELLLDEEPEKFPN